MLRVRVRGGMGARSGLGWTSGVPVRGEDATAPAEAVVLAAKVDGLDAQLAQGGRAHDARLDGHVERRVGERVRSGFWGEGVVCQDGVDGLELCVTGCLDPEMGGRAEGAGHG